MATQDNTENGTTDLIATIKSLGVAVDALHEIATSEHAWEAERAADALKDISALMIGDPTREYELPNVRHLAPIKPSPLDHYAGVLAEALMTGGEVPPRPNFREHVSSELTGAELKARVCECGHTAYWHGSPNGTGRCEDVQSCACTAFRPKDAVLVEHVENGLVSGECLQTAVEGVAAMDEWVAEQQAADRGRR